MARKIYYSLLITFGSAHCSPLQPIPEVFSFQLSKQKAQQSLRKHCLLAITMLFSFSSCSSPIPPFGFCFLYFSTSLISPSLSNLTSLSHPFFTPSVRFSYLLHPGVLIALVLCILLMLTHLSSISLSYWHVYVSLQNEVLKPPIDNSRYVIESKHL